MKNQAPSTCVRCGAPLAPLDRTDRPCPRCLFGLGLEKDDVAVPTGSGAGLEGGASPFPALDELTRLHPELEFKEVLGEGGMGIVYRATQRSLGRDVALKILRKPALGEAESAGFEERFDREARTLARLSHPNIVNVYDSGQRGSHFYLLLEFVEGTNLRHVIQTAEAEPAEALGIVGQICSALAYAHAEGVVHRDIKPENILIDRAGRVKIADFGLAKIAGTGGDALRLTRTDQAMGTPAYMAPEQLERPLEVDHRADIYSLGVVFYELLTGELPLGRFPQPSEMVHVDVRLDSVVLRALEKEPQRRYQQASEISTDIDALQHTATRREPESQRAAEPREVDRGAGANDRHHEPSSRPRSGCSIAGWIVVAVLVLFCFPAACLALFIPVTASTWSGQPAEPTQVEPTQVEPTQVEPNQAEPNGAEHGQVEPGMPQPQPPPGE